MNEIEKQIELLRGESALLTVLGFVTPAKQMEEAANTIEKLSSRIHEELAIQYAQGYNDGFMEGLKMTEDKE